MRSRTGLTASLHRGALLGLVTAAAWLPTFALSGCKSRPSTASETERAALTAAGNSIVGFEDATLWKVTQGSIPAPILNSRHTQGTSSLAVRAAGYVFLTSASFAVSADITGPFTIDVLLPTQQANPSWFGASQIFLTCPAKNTFNAYVGQVELTGLSTNTFHTLTFAFPSALATTFKGGCVDLTVGVVLNVPSNETGTYLIDNLTFGGSGNRVKPTVNCVSTFDGAHYTAFFGYVNLENQVASIPIGSTNTFSPPFAANSGQPTFFQPGTIPTAASVNFTAGQTPKWTLTSGSATASSTSPICANSGFQNVHCADAQQQTDAGCVRVATLPSTRGPNQDPSIRGETFPLGGATVAPDAGVGVEEEEGEGAIDTFKGVTQAIELQPTQQQTFNVPIGGVGVVHGNIRWTTPGSASLQVIVNGVSAPTTATSLPNGGGTIAMRATASAAGSAQVIVTNTGSTVLPGLTVAVGFNPAK